MGGEGSCDRQGSVGWETGLEWMHAWPGWALRLVCWEMCIYTMNRVM